MNAKPVFDSTISELSKDAARTLERSATAISDAAWHAQHSKRAAERRAANRPWREDERALTGPNSRA